MTRAAEERQVLRDDGVDETMFIWDNQNIVCETVSMTVPVATFVYL